MQFMPEMKNFKLFFDYITRFFYLFFDQTHINRCFIFKCRFSLFEINLNIFYLIYAL